MEISSINWTSCFDFALDFLGWVDRAFLYQFCSSIGTLQTDVRLLQSLYLYLTNCRRRRNHEPGLEQDEEEKDVISFRIQDMIIRRMHDLEFVCSKYSSHSRSRGLTEIKSELTKFREAIKLFWETDIGDSCIDFLLDYYWLRDPGLVVDFIDSVLQNLAELLRASLAFPQSLIASVKALEEKLMFLKSFIHFAMLHGVEGQELIDLLIHAEVVAIRALCLVSFCWFDMVSIDMFDEEVCNEIELQISRLIREKPQVWETYIHVLTASNLSRSSDTSALEKNKHLVVDFMDCLVHNIAELLESCTSSLFQIMSQMLKLHEGLRILIIHLRQPKKFNKLRHEMKNLIGIVVCDAAIVIFSLFVNQIEEGLAKETDLALFHLLKVLKFIRAEVTDPVTSASPFGFPRTNELGSMDFLLENLKELENCNEADDSIGFPKDQIHIVLEDLEFLRSFLGKMVDQRSWNGKFQALWNRVMEVACRAEFVIDSIVVGDKHEYLERVARDIQLLKTEALEIYDSTRHDSGVQRTNQKSFHIESKRSTLVLNEVLVGLDDEVKTIIDRLTRGSERLDFVSIVGMAGVGKTTLASRVYNHPSILSHFHVLAWCTVSQVYSMENLLVQILSTISAGSHDQYLKMKKNDLAENLYKRLKKYRYIIILDDVWDIEAWNLLKNSLPDDANGSRILFTSRIQLQFIPNSKAHHLRQLTDEESRKLLQKKLFGNEEFPPTLSKVGSQIAKFCRGLPLTIVLVAGILANTAKDCWEKIAESLTSSIVLEDEYCKKTLELSYSHLPDDLKPCFVYFGAFQEDKNIPVQRLLWLWISEGFVRKTEGKRLEDVADDYLKVLVDRSLVMATKQRTTGGVKTCQIHDLVHEFCVEKAKEENFLHIIHSWRDPFNLTSPSNSYRVCDQGACDWKIPQLMLFLPNLRSLLLLSDPEFMPEENDLGFWLPKLLRVLDLGKLEFDAYFPMEVAWLVHLRYLALSIRGIDSIPSSIANLSRLQIFLVSGNSTNYLLPKTIWNIKTLRHLRNTRSDYGFIFPVENLEVSPCLDHLDTLDLAIDPSSQSLQMILAKLPSIRRLKCKRSKKSGEEPTGIGHGILVFDILSQLESLRLCGFVRYGFKFPLNLKKLILSRTAKPWSEISTIGKLPNLEVLKLLYKSFAGEEWEMKEGEFPNLRVLKLSGLDFRIWTASSENFPRLEKLLLHFCPKLQEVPSCLGECPTLEMIEVNGCAESVGRSAEQIQEEQKDMGNEGLKIVIDYAYSVIDYAYSSGTGSSSEEEDEE